MPRLSVALCATLLLGCGSSQPGAGGTGGSTGATGGSIGTGGSPPAIGTPMEPGDPGAADVTFTIRTDMDVHPISPLIYGWNGADAIADDGQTVVRAGGNRWTAYNWENNASNAGSDYLFQNDDYLDSSTAPGDAVKSTLDPAKSHGAAALITIPIVDYVAADTSPGGNVQNSGSDYLMTRFKQNAPAKGSAFTLTPSTSDAHVYQDEFANWVKANYGAQQVVFSLDNEPDLWYQTHAEVHPDQVTYAELVMRNTEYAAAVKAVWPAAEVAGFVSYGWYGYEALQEMSPLTDMMTYGEFLTYYLDQMKAAEQTAGKRLVDYLDLHWYPETYVSDGYMGQSTTRIIDQQDPSSAIQTARLQAPRSLWDPNYNENNWIAQSIPGPIMLIPRLKQKIAAHYPGTKLSFSEYTYGGGHDITGGVAEADVLGIFGREGVDMATAWNWPDSNDGNVYEIAGLKAFRNYDGNGATFGDVSIHGVTTDDAASSVYASVDSADPNRVVIVAINKKTTSATAGIKVAHPTAFTAADVYTLTSAGPTLAAAPSLSAIATNAFRYAMPPISVSVILLKP
ncbi:MAG TPA: glycoside hydrolase family 44 protein [Polyangia bacterium]|nr:glycoside hydrolase family 44 protein [Polyangia bacterium]